MRWSALLFVLILGGIVLGGVGGGSRAEADKVKTNQPAKLYSHPGEAGEVLSTIKAGTTMTVLSKDGRWLKVRFNGRTGYVPRSKVDMPDDDDIQRNTRRRPFVDGRGTKRGFGGEAGPDDRVGADATGETGTKDSGDGDDSGAADEPKTPTHKGGKKPPKSPPKGGGDDDGDDGGAKPDDDDGGDKPDKPDKTDKGSKDDAGDADAGDTRPTVHVSAAAKAYDEPNKTSAVAFKAKADQKLFVEDKRGKWTEVSADDGSIGWVLTSQLEADSESDGDGGGGAGKRMIEVRARVGAAILNQGLRSTGSTTVGVPDNYNIGTSAAVLALGGQYLLPYKSSYLLGGEINYAYSKAYPGIAYMSQDIAFSMHDLDVRALAGYDLHKPSGMTIFGRLGYRYQSFLVADVTNFAKNTAMLPSEIDKGPSIGAALWMPKLTPKIGIRVSLDALFYGVNQTKNLEDGSSPSAKGIDLGGAFTYHWKDRMDFQATYDLNYNSVSFGPPVVTSKRDHMGTSVSRTDVFHTIAVGITRAF